MKTVFFLFASTFLIFNTGVGQNTSFDKVKFLLGNWSGSGSGFGNEKSNIESEFNLIMGGKYIEVRNESWFDPTSNNPEGEHHIDKGFISYDSERDLIVFRQFNNEGYVNRYILIDSLSGDSQLVFETEFIENFVPGGKARWTINKLSQNQIETIFDVSTGNKGYTCFGKNLLIRK